MEVAIPLILIIVIAIDLCGTGKNWQKGTIEMLPDDTLLEIFDFYRVHHNVDRRSHGLPWKWYRLAHVCRRWRHVISTSPRRLDLQIFCKSSKPIERVLHVWPTLPVVVQFRGRLKSKSLPKNVVIALRQTDRVCKIDLSVPTPIRQSIADMMQVPFPALESILIESKSAPEPLVIDEFLGDSVPRLKEIRAEGFAIPFLALRRLLLFTDNLVTLKLYDIPESCSFPPDALVTILSSSDHLNDLLVRFHPPASRLTTNMEPPLQHSTFPSLISLDFYGASEYLDAFVARAHMPVLDLLTTGFFNQAIFEIPHLSGLLSRLEGFKGLRGVSIRLEEKSVAVRFSKDVWTNPTRWHLSIQCRQLDWQLSFITQIFNQLSPLLSGANWLELYKPGSAPTGGEEPTTVARIFSITASFLEGSSWYACTCTGHCACPSQRRHGCRSITQPDRAHLV